MGLSQGVRLGPYEIVERIGSGGMGEVYLAIDSRLDRRVAIKVLLSSQSPTDEAKARLEREARALSALNHPNICHLYDVGVHEGSTFLVMEFVEGMSLAACLKKDGAFSPEQVFRLAVELADALSKAHSRGILHRDLKPANVVMTESGAKLLDFGLAKPAAIGAFSSMATVGSSVTRAGFIVGTFEYMSPEQLEGKELDERSDIFSLGVLLYECATGSAAFVGPTTASTIARIMTAEPASVVSRNALMPAELDEIIRKCLAKKPEDRYRSAEEVVSALRQATSATAVRKLLPVRAPAFPPIKWIAVVAAAALAIGFGVYFWTASTYRPNPDALRWYDRGMLAIEDGANYTAANMFSHAVTSDPRFALAHARLAEAWMELDDGVRAREELLRAAGPSGTGTRLSSIDQQVLDATYRKITGDYAGALAAYQAIAEKVPADQKTGADMDLARTLERMGRSPEALSIYTRIATQQPQYATAWLRQGILETNKGDYPAAEASLDRALGLYQGANNLEGVATTYLSQAAVYAKTGKIAQAKERDSDALRLGQDTSDLQVQVNALVHFGYMALEDSTAECEKYVNQAIELARGAGAEHLVIKGLHQLGNVYFLRGDPARAESYFSQELTLARNFHAEYSEAGALFSLGSVRITQLRPTEGTAAVEEALKYYTRVQRTHEVLLGKILLGRGYAENLRYDDAIAILREAGAAAEKQGDAVSLYSARNYLGWVLQNVGRAPEALSIYRDICLGARSARDTANACSAYGDLLWTVGNYDEAAKRYHDAEEAGSKTGMNAALADVHLGLSEMSVSRRQFPAAKREADAVTGLAPRPGERIVLAIVLAKIDAASGNRHAAGQRAREAILNAKDLPPRLQAEAMFGAAEVALAAGEFRDALAWAAAVHDQLQKVGQLERSWRAAVIAALASESLHDREQSLRWTQMATRESEALQSSWGEAFAGYSGRPDIKELRTRLATIK